ncbi:uncharacterized protein [Nicotiana sylvestris]|uniref:uncharacterized protein n=1 Tax=Nicotiana sylvestris TaxID=4096 RepID=UPI00388CA868
MLHHTDKAYVDPLHIQVRDQHAYCNVVEEELDGEPWFHDIREYIKMGVYPVQAMGDQKRTIRRLASGFFLSGGILYKRTPDLGLLRCIDAKQATTIMIEVHSRVEAMTFKSMTKKAVVDFVHSNLICRFGIPKVIITDNGANLRSHLKKVGDTIPYKNEAQHMWNLKIIVEKDTIEPDRYHTGHAYFYPSWLDDNISGIFEPRVGPGNRVIDEVAEAQVKYNKLRK